MGKIIKYVLYDILRNRIVIGYTLFLLLVSLGLFSMQADTTKAVLSLLNVVLLTVPLISIIFGTIHFYNSYEFVEMLVAQPINRKKIFFAEYLAVALSLSVAFLFGVGIPALILDGSLTSVYLTSTGIFLSFIFSALAFLASVATRDKAKGIGLALMLWFYFALLYDGLVMLILLFFSDYPLENASLVMLSLNPVDLGRVLVLLNIDVSALMGYTGALFKNLFGSMLGISYAFALMILWVIVPLFGRAAFLPEKICNIKNFVCDIIFMCVKQKNRRSFLRFFLLILVLKLLFFRLSCFIVAPLPAATVSAAVPAVGVFIPGALPLLLAGRRICTIRA